MAAEKTAKIVRQLETAGLPTGGAVPFEPRLDVNKKGEPIVRKAPAMHGPKKGKYGYVDIHDRIWIKDRAHGDYPDHWDVQENGGKRGYKRVDSEGNILP